MSRTPTEEEMESEATHFAMCLLMPADEIRKLWRERHPDGKFDIETEREFNRLAGIFGVSEQLIIFRLIQLGEITITVRA